MVTRIINIILIISFLTFLTSCNEKEKQNAVKLLQGNSKIENLTGNKNKKWEIISYTKNGVNLLSKMDKCVQDNMDVYFYDHSFVSIEGELKCNSEDPYLRETGFWYFNDDSTEVEVTIGTEFYILKIIELSTDKFHYIYTNHNDTTVLRLSSSTDFD